MLNLKIGSDANKVGLDEKRLQGMLDLIQDCDIVGLSFFSVHAHMAKVVALQIKKRFSEKVIISGGIHASLCPNDVLEYSDYVCVGEGEKSLLEFVETVSFGHNRGGVQGVFSKEHDNGFHASSVAVENLDEVPLPMFFFNETFVYLDDCKGWVTRDPSMIIPVNDKGEAANSYYVFPDRGCARSCTYCCRPKMKELSGYKKIRKRSVENVIMELQDAKENIPNMQKVFVYSDDFLCWRMSELEEFTRLYVEKIGLQFSFLLTPASFREDKTDVLLQSGLVSSIGMGIQTGSQRIRKIYNRKESNEKIIKTTQQLKKLSKKHKFILAYDFIIDSPWENDNDKLLTLKLICQIPKPFCIELFTLTFYPGTKLYDTAIEDGILNESAYYDQMGNYVNNKLRISSKETDSYIRICKLCSTIKIPFFVARLFYRYRIALPRRFVIFMEIWAKHKMQYNSLSFIPVFCKFIFHKLYRIIS